MNYYRKHIGDYARATKHLTMIEHGAYNLMMDEYYHSERPLPGNMEDLYRKLCARTPEERWAVDSILKQFFTPSTYDLFRNKFVGFRQKRVDEEILAYLGQSKQNRMNGLSGGRPKSENKPTGLRVGSENNPNQEPRTTNQKPVKDKSIVPSAPLPIEGELKASSKVQHPLFQIWQEGHGPLSRAQGLSPDRLNKCRARMKAHASDPERFLAEFQNAFLTGSNDRGWKANFDWFIANDSNYLKVLEGKYDGEAMRHSEVTIGSGPSANGAVVVKQGYLDKLAAQK